MTKKITAAADNLKTRDKLNGERRAARPTTMNGSKSATFADESGKRPQKQMKSLSGNA